MPTLEEHQIYYRDRGQGPAVLLVHSSASSGGQWQGLRERLGDGYRWLAPDLYGHGRTPPWPGDPQDPERAYGLEDEAGLLAAVAETAGAPVHVVGHSYGGAACLRLAVTHPHLVRSLTVYEPTLVRVLLDAGRREAWRQVYEPAMEMVALTEAGQPAAGARRFLGYLMGDGAWEAQTEEQRALVTALMPVTVMRECRAQMLDPAITLRSFETLPVPTTFVVGSESPAALITVSEVLAQVVPDATLVRLPGAGHMAPVTAPAAFEGVVRSVLGGEPRTGVGPDASTSASPSPCARSPMGLADDLE